MTSKDLTALQRRPAIFFDRDGVLNMDTGYPHLFAEMRWVDGAIEAVRMANQAGYYVFVVTNQSGVARGLYDEPSVMALHRHMTAHFAENGAVIDDFRYCPHLPDAPVPQYRRDCDCRKPAPGMIRDLLAAWPVDPAHAFLVGDRATDLAAAQAAGIAGHLYESGSLSSFIAPLLKRYRIST